MSGDELVRGTRIEYIRATDSPDDETLERLQRALRSLSRVREAWLLGIRVHPPDGSQSEQSEIALIFDPPCKPGELSVNGFSALIRPLIAATGWGNWRALDRQKLAQFWGDAAVNIYERPSARE